jgi:hypothetical protein
MVQPESREGIVAFEEFPISVGEEALAMSRTSLVSILQHLDAVSKGAKDFNKLKIWKSYRGIPLFMPEIEGELMVYAVETLGVAPTCKISVMFAGVRRAGFGAGAQRWDGSNDEVLWRIVVLPRCERHFGST